MSTGTGLAQRIDTIINRAIEKRVFPGAVVLMMQHGEPLHAAAYGTTMYDHPGSQPVARDSIYDLASITKMFTATAALQLFEAGRLELDAPVAAYLPAVQARSVTIRHLLTHSSGLELRMSSLRTQPPDAIRAAVYAVEPSRPPGTHTAYVNINTLLLGDVVAQISGQPLDEVIRQRILEPLGMQETGFTPAPDLRPRIVPTEWDEAWRSTLVWGTVHDESAAALGGVAGHAGLFGTADDLGRFVQMWLHGGSLDGVRLLSPATVAEATRFQPMHLDMQTTPPPLRCGLGWMINRESFMGYTPAGTYGHTGFTGPVVVVVPQHQLGMVLLSNRTYPRRGERTHLPVTAAVVAAALAAG